MLQFHPICFGGHNNHGSNHSVGGLAGFANEVTNSFTLGDTKGYSLVGGIVGLADSIKDTYAMGNVFGHNDLVGGIVGQANGHLEDNVFTGNVMGRNKVGGIAGSAVSLNKCQGIGDVIGKKM